MYTFMNTSDEIVLKENIVMDCNNAVTSPYKPGTLNFRTFIFRKKCSFDQFF